MSVRGVQRLPQTKHVEFFVTLALFARCINLSRFLRLFAAVFDGASGSLSSLRRSTSTPSMMRFSG
jgi:hypothetical protein